MPYKDYLYGTASRVRTDPILPTLIRTTINPYDRLNPRIRDIIMGTIVRTMRTPPTEEERDMQIKMAHERVRLALQRRVRRNIRRLRNWTGVVLDSDQPQVS